MKNAAQEKYSHTDKGKDARARARKKYDEADPDRRREQKRHYMRRKRLENPNYCKWKWPKRNQKNASTGVPAQIKKRNKRKLETVKGIPLVTFLLNFGLIMIK